MNTFAWMNDIKIWKVSTIVCSKNCVALTKTYFLQIVNVHTVNLTVVLEKNKVFFNGLYE